MKNLMIFKVEEKKTDNAPDYRVVVSVDDQLQECGAGWIKDGAKGKFISVKLADDREWEYEGKTHSRSGYHLTKDTEGENKPSEPKSDESPISADDIF